MSGVPRELIEHELHVDHKAKHELHEHLHLLKQNWNTGPSILMGLYSFRAQV
jgi:hypothetical protein